MTRLYYRPSSPSQVTAKKHLKLHIKRIREREYSKLRALIPAVASKKKVTKVQVIEEAVRYIDELHKTLLERLREKHGYDAVGIAEETVKNFVYQLMPQSRQLQPSQAQVNFEKQQKRASFLAKRRRRDD